CRSRYALAAEAAYACRVYRPCRYLADSLPPPSILTYAIHRAHVGIRPSACQPSVTLRIVSLQPATPVTRAGRGSDSVESVHGVHYPILFQSLQSSDRLTTAGGSGPAAAYAISRAVDLSRQPRYRSSWIWGDERR